MAGQKVKVQKDNSERWMLTYADVMNLLLILFIILYTMANVDVAKYQQVAASMRSAFGSATPQVIGDGGGAQSMIDLGATAPSSVVPSTLEEEQMEQVEQKVENLVSSLGLSGQVDVSMQERGIYISIGEQVLFTSGSADIEDKSKSDIIKIGKEILAKIPGKQMRVEGHTDNIPISNSRFPDNQELSTARANSVWRILVNNAGIDPSKLSATGYGPYRPKVKNDTPEHRKINRRVDIVILRDIYDTAEPGADASSGTASGTSSGTAVGTSSGTALGTAAGTGSSTGTGMGTNNQ